MSDKEIIVLSLEEQEIVLNEATDLARDIEKDSADVSRLTDTAEILEDVADISDATEKATPVEAALLEKIGDMAVAGTDIEAEQIVPSMENFVGEKLSDEAILRTADRVWHNLKTLIPELWDKIESFFRKIEQTIPRTRMILQGLEKELETREFKPNTSPIKLTTGLTALSVNHKLLENGHEFEMALKDLEEACRYVFGDWPSFVVEVAETVSGPASKFQIENWEQQSKFLSGLLSKLQAPKVPGSGSRDKMREPGFVLYQGKPLLGNYSLALRKDENAISHEENKIVQTYFKRQQLQLITTDREAETRAAEGTLNIIPLSTVTMKALIVDMLKLLDIVEEFSSGSGYRSISAAKDHLAGSCEKATSVMKESGLLDEADKKSLGEYHYYRSLMSFNETIIYWSQNPAIPFLRHTLQVIKVFTNLVIKSMEAQS